MLTSRSFTTPIQLLNILRARYNIPVPDSCSSPADVRQWKDESQRAIRLRYIVLPLTHTHRESARVA